MLASAPGQSSRGRSKPAGCRAEDERINLSAAGSRVEDGRDKKARSFTANVQSFMPSIEVCTIISLIVFFFSKTESFGVTYPVFPVFLGIRLTKRNLVESEVASTESELPS